MRQFRFLSLIPVLVFVAFPLAAQDAARDALRRDLFEIKIKAVAQPASASGEYVYRYTLDNASESLQRVNAFSVVVNGDVRQITSPHGWSAMLSADRAILHWQATETEDLDTRKVDTGDVPPALFAVEPGETLEGFSFHSHNPPGNVSFFTQGETDIPELGVGGVDFADFRHNGQSGVTTGPKPKCSSDRAVCLPGQRYAIKMGWLELSGEIRSAKPMRATDGVVRTGGVFQAGAAWPETADLIMKVRDGHLQAGSLSGDEYWLEVRDTERGLIRTYHSTGENPCSFLDMKAIPADEGEIVEQIVEVSPQEASAPVVTEWQDDQLIQGKCSTDSLSLCLWGGRFQVDADWFDRRTGASGNGWTMLSGDGWGSFRFSDLEGIDLAVKVVEKENGVVHLSYLPLSELEIRLKVIDRTTGNVWIYRKASGSLCGRAVELLIR